MNLPFIKNERGFTLLESIFQLIVFGLFASLSLMVFVWIQDILQLEKMKNDVNWEFFVYDLNQYNQNSKSGRVIDSGKLQFEILNDSEDRYFVFDKSDNKSSDNHLRKSSNKGGNEIILPYVEQWHIATSGYEIFMKVVMQDGTVRERTLVLPTPP